MKKNKVIAQLMALPEKEFRRFGKFVRNPANNKKDTLIRLYQFVVKNHPEYEERKFTKAQCFLYVFPDLEFQYERLNGKADELVSKKLKNPLYDMKNLIDDFIIQQELADQSHEKTILLIKGLFKRQMYDKAFQLINKELYRLEGMAGDDFYHHFYQFQMLDLKLINSLNKLNLSSSNFEKLQQLLDSFFVHAKLKTGYETKNRAQLFGENIDVLFFEEAKKAIEENRINSTNYAVHFYAKISNLKDTSSLEDYLEVRNFYFDKIDNFPNKLIQEPLIYLLNYCMKVYEAGRKDFLTEMFELYKFGLDHQLLLQNGHLATSDFKNIVVLATTLCQLDWAKKFVTNYAKLLTDNDRENVVLLCKAQVECESNNLRKVLKILQDVEFNDVYDNLMSRSLMLRAYYNLNEWNALEFFLEAYSKFVRRNMGLSEEVKISLFNMIKFTKVLIQAQFKQTSKKQLLEKLESYSSIYNKNWLTLKVNEFK